MVVRQLRLIAHSVVLVACGSSAPPGEVVVDRVDPGGGQSRQVVPVRIEGSGFHLPLASTLDGHIVTGDLRVTVGAVPLEDVVWRGEQLIEGLVPAGLAPGPHDVTVTFALEGIKK